MKHDNGAESRRKILPINQYSLAQHKVEGEETAIAGGSAYYSAVLKTFQ